MKPFRWGAALVAALLLVAPVWAVDLTITAANVKVTDNASEVQRVKLGEAVTQGQAVYRNTTDGKYYKADADLSTAAADASAITITPGSTDEFAFVITEGLMNIGATLTVGEIYVLSSAAGGVCPEADLGNPERVTILGVAKTTSILWVRPFATAVTIP